MLNLKSQQSDIDKSFLHFIDPYKSKHRLLINKHNSLYLKHCDVRKSFIEFTNGINDINKSIKDSIYDMIADIISNKIINPRVTKIFVTGRKLNIFFFSLCSFIL